MTTPRPRMLDLKKKVWRRCTGMSCFRRISGPEQVLVAPDWSYTKALKEATMSEQSTSASSPRPEKQRTCQHCGVSFESPRRTRRFCSRACANRSAWASEKSRACQLCGKSFPLRSAADANRKHCSRACAKNTNAKKINTWLIEHPESVKEYRRRQIAKNPGIWREKARRERLESIRLLGGCCIVCGVTNTNWLHVDYIPTNRASPYRHPRHLAFVKRHLAEFRLLCANHHYELTLTGKIEGTDITQ